VSLGSNGWVHATQTKASEGPVTGPFRSSSRVAASSSSAAVPSQPSPRNAALAPEPDEDGTDSERADASSAWSPGQLLLSPSLPPRPAERTSQPSPRVPSGESSLLL
jgi:hypothetical protein